MSSPELPADAEGWVKVPGQGRAGPRWRIMATHRSNGLFKLKGPKMLKGDHAPTSPLKHAQRTQRFALQLGDQASTPYRSRPRRTRRSSPNERTTATRTSRPSSRARYRPS